jgi:hypothetical protein
MEAHHWDTDKLESTLDALQESEARAPFAKVAADNGMQSLFLRNWFGADHFVTLIFDNGHFVQLYNDTPHGGDVWDVSPLGWGEDVPESPAVAAESPSIVLQDLDIEGWHVVLTPDGQDITLRIVDTDGSYMEARVTRASLTAALTEGN